LPPATLGLDYNSSGVCEHPTAAFLFMRAVKLFHRAGIGLEMAVNRFGRDMHKILVFIGAFAFFNGGLLSGFGE